LYQRFELLGIFRICERIGPHLSTNIGSGSNLPQSINIIQRFERVLLLLPCHDQGCSMEGLDRPPRTRALTEYPVKHEQNWSHLYNTSPTNMPHYPSSGGLNYMTGSHHTHYSPAATTYSTYSAPYVATSSSQAAFYLPMSNSMPYSVRPPPRSATLPSQHRTLSRAGYGTPTTQSQHSPHLPLRTSMAVDLSIMDTEEQDSVNCGTMKSESIEPPLQGYPEVNAFDNLMKK